MSDSGIMTMTPLTRDQAGLYACQARNEAGRSIKPVDLRVSFPASVTALNITGGKLVVAGNTDLQANVMMESGNKVVLTCEVRAWPEPNIEWSRDGVSGVASANASLVSTSQADLDQRVSSYEISSATCRDNGKYTCKAWNNVGLPSYRTAYLNISCPPFETNKSMHCQNGEEVRIIRDLYTILNINVCFFGIPTAAVTLSHITDKNDVRRSYAGDVACNYSAGSCESVFSFNISSEDQYGVYIAKISNSLGYFEKKYTVTAQQPPFLPSMFTVFNIFQTSACFSWFQSFNGGAKQTFILKILATDKETRKSDGVNTIRVEEDETRTSDNNSSTHSVCVTNLRPATDYEAVLTTANKFGVSDSSKYIGFTTVASINSTISIPSWLSLVGANAESKHSDQTAVLPTGKSASSWLGTNRIPLKRLTTQNPKYRIKSALHYLTLKNEHEGNEDNEMNLPDDAIYSRFFQLFDLYFNLNTIKTGNFFKSQKNPPLHISSNYSSIFDHLLFKYSRAQDRHLIAAPATNRNTSSVWSLSVSSSTLAPSTSLTTLLDKSKATPMSLTTFTSSGIFIGSACILGATISSCFIAFFKRRQLQRFFQERCSPRERKRCCSKRACGLERSSPSRVHGQEPERIPARQRLSSVTCVYNENVSFSSPVASRPRLSTPDVKSLREKVKSKTSKEFDKCSDGNLAWPQCDVPTITLENNRVSCPSYLELYHTERSSFFDTEEASPLDSHYLSPTEQLDQAPVSPVQLFACSSAHQTQIKRVSYDEPDTSGSYLDLYEDLTARSRSRSPSNIYDSFLLDVLDSNSCPHNSQYQNEPKDLAEETDTSADIVDLPDKPAEAIRIPLALWGRGQVTPDRVQLRPKNGSTKMNPSNFLYLPKAIEKTPNVSYELVEPGSRKHLASGLYLPMTSAVNFVRIFSGDLSYINSEVFERSENVSNIVYENPQQEVDFGHTSFVTGMPIICIGDQYEVRIPQEITVCTSQPKSKVHLVSSNDSHYVDIDVSCRKAVTEDLTLPDKSITVSSVKGNAAEDRPDHTAKASDVFSTTFPHSYIYEIDGYVQEDTISTRMRDSARTASLSSCSVYSNETEVFPYRQSASSTEHEEQRFGKLSPENNFKTNSSRNFSFSSQSKEVPQNVNDSNQWDIAKEEHLGHIEDTRDSGVSFNYRRSRQIHTKKQVRAYTPFNNSSSSSGSNVEVAYTEQVLYEEPVLTEHIYAEV